MKAINLVCGTLHPRCFQHFNYLTIQAHVAHNTIYRMCDALALVQITWFIWPRMLYSHVFKISTHIPHYHITYHAFKREDEGKPHYQASITCTICVACTFCPTFTAAVGCSIVGIIELQESLVQYCMNTHPTACACS